MTSEVKRELAPLKDSTETVLKYDNYSVVMNASGARRSSPRAM